MTKSSEFFCLRILPCPSHTACNQGSFSPYRVDRTRGFGLYCTSEISLYFKSYYQLKYSPENLHKSTTRQRLEKGNSVTTPKNNRDSDLTETKTNRHFAQRCELRRKVISIPTSTLGVIHKPRGQFFWVFSPASPFHGHF